MYSVRLRVDGMHIPDKELGFGFRAYEVLRYGLGFRVWGLGFLGFRAYGVYGLKLAGNGIRSLRA